MSLEQKTILVIEDGDEYLDNLSRFVPGPTYIQVHTGAEAIEFLTNKKAEIIYLDMRFDRILEDDLLGDRDGTIKEHNGDPLKAMRFLQNNQGLYILAALKKDGLDNIPIILAYDFTSETKRFEYLRSNYKTLTWVPDAITPGQIEELFNTL